MTTGSGNGLYMNNWHYLNRREQIFYSFFEELCLWKTSLTPGLNRNENSEHVAQSWLLH